MKKVLGILSCLILLYSCDKETNVNGIVQDHGPQAADGCGWLIQVGDDLLKPTNLDVQYQIDNLPIVIDYIPLESHHVCGLVALEYDEIEIINID